MNWSIFATIVVIAIGFGILLTFRNKPITKNSEMNILQAVKTYDEMKAQETENSINFNKIFNPGKRAKSSEALLHEYLHPEIQMAEVQRQKYIGGIIGLTVGIVLFLVIQGQMRAIGLIFPLVGYAAPIFWFNSRRKAMQQTVIDAIPDLLGYLSIFAPSLNVYKAMELIINNAEDDNILYASLRESIQEYRLGRDLYDSLTEKANALGVQEWISCIFTLNEGVRIGKNIKEVIMEIEEDFRNERKLKLEMEASKVTTKLSLISSMMFMPAIYTYTMVPAYLQLFKAL